MNKAAVENENTEIKNVINELEEIELEKFNISVGVETDTTMLVLRAHLFSESLLERLIRLNLPRGDKLIEGSSFTFAQKLMIIEALDSLPDSIVSSLRGLNKLRNQCAHELGRKLSEADVVRIGSPLGKIFTKMHRDCKYDELMTFRKVFSHIAGFMAGVCHSKENQSHN